MCKTQYSADRNRVHFGESNDTEMRFSLLQWGTQEWKQKSLICMTRALTEVHTECRSIMEDGWAAPWRWGRGWNLHLKCGRVRWDRDVREYKWGSSYCSVETTPAMHFQCSQLNPSSQMTGPGFRSIRNYPFPSWTVTAAKRLKTLAPWKKSCDIAR